MLGGGWLPDSRETHREATNAPQGHDARASARGRPRVEEILQPQNKNAEPEPVVDEPP